MHSRNSSRARARLGLRLTLAVTLVSTCLLALTTPLLAVQVAQGTTEENLISFFPKPDHVFIQLTSQFPGIGNVRVLAELSTAEVSRLKDETGRTDFVVLGPDGNQTVLRDDGQGADDVAGDGLFSGVANVDTADLDERSSTDNTKVAESGGEVPVFDGRVLTGSEPAVGFDLDDFNRGAIVELTDPVETLSNVKVAETASAAVRLLASDGDVVRAQAAAMVVPGINAFQNQVLMITDPSVVADSSRTIDPCTGLGNTNGVWTFKHLMTEMANQAATGINPSAFVEGWLNHWLTAQTINSDNVPARIQMQSIIDQWRAASGGGDLDLAKAPVRLLAIVSRLDLATTRGGGSGYGTRTGDFLDAGEARFIFGFVLPPQYIDNGFFNAQPITGTNNCRSLPFTVIFEYRVPRCDCKGVRSWARQWVNLANLPFPSATYNKALERITEQFAVANANPIRPNGSAIGQVRTNEIALALNPPTFLWELREFQLTQKPWSLLHETTVADTPNASFNNSPTFSSWVLGPVLSAGGGPIPPVPLFFLGAPFLGGHAPVPPNFWTGPGINFGDPTENEARFRASLAACQSCHRQETLTPFVHVDPSSPSLPATLSGFLTGISNVPDAASGAPLRDFDDLARRELDIKRKARMLCLRFHPINRTLVLASLKQSRVLPPDPFEGGEILPLEEQISVAEDALIGDPVSEVH